MKCTALWDEPGAMIDACIATLATDDLYMQFDVCYISTIHVQFSVTRSMHGIFKICTSSYVIKAGV